MKKLQQIIEAGYKSLGYDELGRGYRFLSSPKSTIGADRLVMSINPAGNRPDWENDAMFTEEGKSAYVDERWMEAPLGSSKLQVQFQALFEYLGWDTSEVLQAPFSPYRHPSWAKIPRGLKNATVAFCIGEIWEPYFADHMPKEIICIGKQPAEAIMAAIPHQVTDQKSVETGWNNAACRYANQYWFDNGTIMIQIPHLSRFGIMTAPSCAGYLSAIFAPVRD